MHRCKVCKKSTYLVKHMYAVIRMRVDKNGGAWCPRNMIGRDASEWIEIDLRALHVITAAETMGRFGNGQGAEYAEAYVIEYYR
jgi:discoidin domain receptor family protein 2